MPLQPDGYTFPLNEKVARTHVRFTNRYGIPLAGDLYTLEKMESRTYPALVVGPPHGGIKEQGPGLYANELAQRGFVALAFDPPFMGESGGGARHVTSPELFAESFSAGVDFLGSQPFVDRRRIGAIGICGSGGFALSAASVDVRIRAVATAAMYDISGATRDGWMYQGTDDERREHLAQLAEQRWKDVDTGAPELSPQFPLGEYDPEALAPITAEFFEYYAKINDRGWHPRSIGAFTVESGMPHVSFGQLRNLKDIPPRKTLIITGSEAHSKWFSDIVAKEIGADAEEVVVPGARHIDLYDRTDLIPFDTITELFSQRL
ncbi:alpha/beta hydrolase [Actinomyces viscosus]|uniref:Uncharacterized conserved protein n=1 Tax=Actinomyces viscosus TaxID=1656 RepID=A0A3S4WKF9_ACTVI|nr:alpha/beta hydrolase [Actinomyces viscosus]TFH52432.1 alpha/beta hydrolase [Actinomyces viscosus]VEI17154.1 Uncharacterized conserved protein [Actinomyces viscosus]